MGLFEFPSAAALAQLKSESLSTSPVDRAASKAAGIGSKILELANFLGATTLTDLILELKNLAANKDEENLIYFGEALVDDISRLYRMNDEMRRRVDELPKSKEFHQAVANATLHITRTNVEVRLRRVATLIANSVRTGDLELESLDDMMRAAVELKDIDIAVLAFISSRQSHLLDGTEKDVDGWPHAWLDRVQKLWQDSLRERGIVFAPRKFSGGEWRSALSRLQAFGFIAAVQPNPTTNSPGEEPFGLLPWGQKFLDRVRKNGSPD